MTKGVVVTRNGPFIFFRFGRFHINWARHWRGIHGWCGYNHHSPWPRLNGFYGGVFLHHLKMGWW